MKGFNFSLQHKFIFSIALIIVPTMSIIFVWAGYQHEKLVGKQLLDRARVLSRQIILTRRWISDCGGVMVRKESPGASGAALFYDDRMETPRGTYRRFTPSMVTKKLSEYSYKEETYWFRLVSLAPMNPDNLPDPFEEEALSRFAEGEALEIYRRQNLRGKRLFQYMVPLHRDKSCFKCHKNEDSVYGGLSVFFPTDRLAAFLANSHLKLAAAGFCLILVVVFTLFTLLRKVVITPLKELEKMTGEITDGNYRARVELLTGDEFEHLGNSFNIMGGKLEKNHEHMKREIDIATRELKTLDKLKSDFLANMSHELRSPLTVIRGGVDYLGRTVKEKEERNYLSIIDKNLKRLIHLVTDIFDFTRIEANKVEWSFNRENISELIMETIEIIGPIAAEKEISITFQEGQRSLEPPECSWNSSESLLDFSSSSGRFPAGAGDHVKGTAAPASIGKSMENIQGARGGHGKDTGSPRVSAGTARYAESPQGDPGVFAEIDLERIEQVLVNLIDNAVKFSERGSSIHLTVAKDRGRVSVGVRDHGPGIPHEKLEKIFEKFQTLPGSGKKGVPKGTGLGLAISRKIIQAHGGEITASNAKGGGALFCIFLPCDQ